MGVSQWIALALAVLWHALTILLCAPLRLDDGFYHLRQAQILRDQGLFAGISSLPLTVLQQNGPDHHLLLHVLQIPLTFLPYPWDLRLGMLLFALVATLGTWGFLRWSRVPWAGWWTLALLAGSEVYGFRVSILRAQSLDLPLLLVGIGAAATGRVAWAFGAALLFSWAHHGATLLGPVAVVAALAARWRSGQWQLRAPVWLSLGFVVGQLVNPYLPRNLEYLFFHVLWKTSNPLGLPVGTEWEPVALLNLLWWLAPLLVALGWVAWQVRRAQVKPEADTLAMLGMAGLLVGLCLRHQRFGDFAAATLLAGTALLARDADLLAQLSRRSQAALLAAVVALAAVRGTQVHSHLNKGEALTDWDSTAAALGELAHPGELVLNLRWDQYCVLTYHAPQLRWGTGLDPNYLAYQSPEATKLWLDLRRGRANPSTLGQDLARLFGARLVLGPPAYAAQLGRYDQLEVVARSPKAWIWRVKGQTAPVRLWPRDGADVVAAAPAR